MDNYSQWLDGILTMSYTERSEDDSSSKHEDQLRTGQPDDGRAQRLAFCTFFYLSIVCPSRQEFAMDDHNESGDVLNHYGAVATHDDCTHSGEGQCEGHMLLWENPRSYNTMLMCEHHAERSDKRQSEIFKNYYFDSAEY